MDGGKKEEKEIVVDRRSEIYSTATLDFVRDPSIISACTFVLLNTAKQDPRMTTSAHRKQSCTNGSLA
jgi:hypothetical protein